MNDSSRTRRRPNWTTTVAGLCIVGAALLYVVAGAGVGPGFPLFFGLLGAGATVGGLCGQSMGLHFGGGGGGGFGGGFGGGRRRWRLRRRGRRRYLLKARGRAAAGSGSR